MAEPLTVAPATAPAAVSVSVPDRRSRRGLWLVLLVTLANIVGIAAYEVLRTHPGGDELRLDYSQGWYAAYEVGTVFTDGITVVPLTSQQRGPLRLISARPLMDGDATLRVLGVLARVLPGAASASPEAAFQSAPGFPTTAPGAVGAVEVAGLQVPASTFETSRSLQLQIGYEVTGTGRANRLGIELVYEHGGFRHRAVIPSHLTICAPATVACAARS